MNYNSEKEILQTLNVKKYFYWAAGAFIAWAFFCGIVREKGVFFPANWLNMESFCEIMTVPVHLFRTICAIIIVWAISGMLKIFNWEMFKKLQLNQIETEKQLKNAEQKYMDIVDNSTNIIQSVDTNGFILLMNKKGCELLGYFREEIIGRHIKEIYASETWENMEKGFKELKQKGTLFVGDGKMLKKNGETIDVEIQSLSIYDNNGNFVRTRSIIRDVTEHKKLESLILQEKQDWENLFNTITDMITIHDNDFNIIRANKAAEKILNLPILDKNKAKCYKYYHGKDCNPPGCPSCQAIKTGKFTNFEIFEPHLNMWLEIRAIPRIDENNLTIGLIHIVRDITERKKIEQTLKKTEQQFLQSQKMEAVGRLAGGIAHDFNNLLTVIKGYTELLLMGFDENDSRKDSADEIKKAADRAASLTRQLLAFSRKQVFQSKDLNINTLVSDMTKMLHRLIGEDIELVTSLSSELGFVNADPGQLEQVILNIVVNARDAMPKGGKLIIETANVELDETYSQEHIGIKPGQYVMLAISDTGHGIPEDIRSHIFEPFFTTKEKDKGTGLGLSTVYGIIKQSGGYIWLYSEPDKGTSFKIYFPQIKEVIKESALTSAPVELQKGNETILLVEDDDMVRNLIRLILEKNGYTVLEAGNAEKVTFLCKQHKGKINIMVSDVIMPKISGPQLFKKVAPLRPDMKVLYMSGYTDEAIVRHGVLEAGINFIQKPFTPDSIIRKIHEVLNKQ